MRIVVWIPVPIYKSAILAEITRVDGAELIVIDDPQELPAALAGAQGMISAGASKYTADVAATIRNHGTSLRWFQTVAAGNDGLAQHGIPAGVTVTGSGGHSAPVVAEHALALLLSIAHCAHDFVAYKNAHTWGGDFRQRYRSLYRKTVAVLGFGNIGVEIARRLMAFDIRVLSVTRAGLPHEAAAEAHKIGALHAVIAQSDALILSLPLTAATRHIIGAAQFSAFRPGAYLVNVGRGGLVDQSALGAALREGRLAGAAIDVTDPEPLPADNPLWDAPNLIISPHCGGAGSSESPKRLATVVRGNLENFLAGRSLNHILMLGA
jgi:phosphoglycerate dehydrogenase-like enzyme